MRDQSEDDPALTHEVRELISRAPRWPLLATLGMAVVLVGLAAWLVPPFL